MKKILITAAAALAFVACKQEAKLDMAKVNKAVDSSFNAEKGDVFKNSNNDCSAHMGKMVEDKADSMMKAKMGAEKK